MLNRIGAIIEPCGIPISIVLLDEFILLMIAIITTITTTSTIIIIANTDRYAVLCNRYFSACAD